MFHPVPTSTSTIVQLNSATWAAMRQNTMIEAVQDSVKKHLWYLTEKLVVFALFDDGFDSAEQRAMATQLASLRNQGNFAPGKPVFPVNLMVRNPNLA